MTDGTTNLFSQVNADQAKEGSQTNDVVYIGEGKKYGTIEDADKAFGHLNQHVTTLEEENAKLRAVADKARTIDEVLEAMRQKQTSVQDMSSQTSEGNHQELDVNAIVQQAVNQMSLREDEKHEVSNAQEVVTKLTTKYGEKAGDIYAKKAAELGVDLDSLAKQSPKAVLAFFEESKAQTQAATIGTVNTASLEGTQAEYGTHEYWNKLERAGAISREKKFQKQHESLQQLGEDKYWTK